MGKTQKKGEKTKGKGKGATLPEVEVRHFLSSLFVFTVNRGGSIELAYPGGMKQKLT